MNKIYRIGTLAATSVIFAAVAGAQTNGPTGFSARLGVEFPKTNGSSFAAGLDYKFREIAVPQARDAYSSYLGASVDYYGKNGDNFNLPIAATYNVRVKQLVLSAGLGLDIYSRGGDSKSGIGGQVGAAYEFGSKMGSEVNPIFASAKYYFANNSNLSGFALYVGYRF